MFLNNFYLLWRRHFIVFNCFIIFLLKYSWCEVCIPQNSCHCIFSNGSSIDLTSLGYHDKPRWSNMKPSKQDNYTYFYNPCFSFKLGPPTAECSKGVAVCQVYSNTFYYDCGDAVKVNFTLNATNILHLIYTAGIKKTVVDLECAPNAEDPVLKVIGEEKENEYRMVLTSKCACPDMCRISQISHLSAGSVLVIIFMIFVAMYLVLGIIHSSLTKGAHGWELIPHYEFWADFPLLVRDGCVFVVSGCKSETAYERI